jgi:putative transposase
MDFVFDRVGGGRAIKNLVIVDDATHEAVAIVPAHHISGSAGRAHTQAERCAARLPDGHPRRQGKEFCGKAMLMWAHEKGVALRLIEPGKPNQNAMSSPSTAYSGLSVLEWFD